MIQINSSRCIFRLPPTPFPVSHPLHGSLIDHASLLPSQPTHSSTQHHTDANTITRRHPVRARRLCLIRHPRAVRVMKKYENLDGIMTGETTDDKLHTINILPQRHVLPSKQSDVANLRSSRGKTPASSSSKKRLILISRCIVHMGRLTPAVGRCQHLSFPTRDSGVRGAINSGFRENITNATLGRSSR